jgi:hypothetical protein
VAIEIFFSYAHEDEELMNAVRQQLVIYERQGKIEKWYDRRIPPGTEWQAAIDNRISHSHIILLFVSPAFLESRYCWDVEVRIALERHEAGSARVIPIILRPCPWDVAPFAKLQALPKDAKPLTQLVDRDQATLDIARAIVGVADELLAAPHHPAPALPADARVRGIYRKQLEGDRIPRLFASFAPPTGINIPAGYQRRLNHIAFEARKDSAVRRADGQFAFPAQFVGGPNAVAAFTRQLSESGQLLGLGRTGDDLVEVWFEYLGRLSPDAVRQLATSTDLRIVHCGVTLVGTPQSPSRP